MPTKKKLLEAKLELNYLLCQIPIKDLTDNELDLTDVLTQDNQVNKLADDYNKRRRDL